MHVLFFFTLFGVASVFAAPTSAIPVTKHAGTVKAGSYIYLVHSKLKQGSSRSGHLNRLLSTTTDSTISHRYDQAFEGYAAHLDAKALEHVQRSNDVEAIFEDGVVHIEAEDINERIGRSVHAPAPLTEMSQFSKRVNGSGVDFYEIGTGIYLQHSQFGGRAFWGATFGGYPGTTDGNGASTHSAALAVGATYGLANQAKIYAVKALSDAGSGSTSDIIAAINWVISAVQASGRPSIIMTTLGGSSNSALDATVNNAISKGIHFACAAGNSNTDAGTISPARVPAAITVGAVDANGNKASFSNYGSVVDVYYYGVNVVSAWIGSPTATNTLSGTRVAMRVETDRGRRW
ncbi:subtilisin-like serine protease [Ceratobasidium sp. 394]|nr:subtilisin-like serine protease [Ceratobasidium sp. 394]